MCLGPGDAHRQVSVPLWLYFLIYKVGRWREVRSSPFGSSVTPHVNCQSQSQSNVAQGNCLAKPSNTLPDMRSAWTARLWCWYW
jgi:hypothetical protein